MAIKYRTRGFVFKKNERAEFDQTFAIFTKDFGRLEIKAKAIRRITSKLRAGIDIFYLSEIEFIQGKNSKTLTDAVKIKKFNEIIFDYQKLKVACQVSDILESFIKGQEKDEKTFDLINEVFNNLTGDTFKNSQLAFQYFFWNFISLQGYHLQTQNCASCQSKLNPYNIYFSGKEGGIVCGNCLKAKKTKSLEPQQKINSDVVKVLRLILKKDWPTVSKLKINQNSQKLLEDISQTATQSFCPVHN